MKSASVGAFSASVSKLQISERLPSSRDATYMVGPYKEIAFVVLAAEIDGVKPAGGNTSRFASSALRCPSIQNRPSSGARGVRRQCRTNEL